MSIHVGPEISILPNFKWLGMKLVEWVYYNVFRPRICSRWDDPMVMHCEECGEYFFICEAVHGYSAAEEDEVEPTSECPFCRSQV